VNSSIIPGFCEEMSNDRVVLMLLCATEFVGLLLATYAILPSYWTGKKKERTNRISKVLNKGYFSPLSPKYKLLDTVLMGTAIASPIPDSMEYFGRLRMRAEN
jgi:hypothetical protein